MADHLCFTVADRSYFSLLKKEIHALVVQAGFSDKKVGEVDIIIAEVVSNIVKHGKGGKLLVKLVKEQNIDGIEMIAIDDGEGMTDLNKMMGDGMSTTNTLGQGLGAIKRLSDVFQVYTRKDWGTILLSRVFKEELPYIKKSTEIRSIVIPKPGETKSGDGFTCKITNDHIKIFLGDGLGHGEEAAKAVNAAIEIFKNSKETLPSDVIRDVHQGVKKTRGLVGTAAIYSRKQKSWSMCGVGNILMRMINGIEMKNNMAYNGIIGYNIPNTMKDQETELANGQVIILCSDGIKTKWDLVKYPGILKYDLSVLAAVLFKDFARHTDDMSVVAVRIN